MKKNAFLSKLLLTVLLAMIGLLFILPLLWMLSSSLKIMKDVFTTPVKWIPDPLVWTNYVSVLTDNEVPFFRAFGNSVWIAASTIIGQLFVSATAAYAFARIKFPGKKVFFIMYLATMMIPLQVTLIPRFVLFKAIGLYNTRLAVILPAMFSVTSIFLLKQYYEAVPTELVESAFLDGARHLTIWSTIMLPLTKHAMASLIILNFISSWNEYLNPLVFLSSKRLYTISLQIDYYNSNELPIINITMAAAVLAILPILLVYISCQNLFVQSIASAGIKG